MKDRHLIEKEIYNKEEIKQGIQKWGYFWDAGMVHDIKEKYRENLARWSDIFLKNKKILILGADHNNVNHCLKYSNKITAIDISDRQIHEINEKFSKVKTIIGDITTYKFEENYYDIIFCASILHHIPDDLEKMFQYFNNILVEKGKVFIFREPLYLNPLLFFGRIFFPSQYHTPNEKPFIFYNFKKLFNNEFVIKKYQFNFFFTLLLSIITKVFFINKIPFFKYIFKKINYFLYFLDKILEKTIVKEFFWYFSLVLQKK